MKKKIISILLLLCMALSMLPTGAIAVEPDQAETIDLIPIDETTAVEPGFDELSSDEIITEELTEDDQGTYNAFDSCVDKLISTDAELNSTGNAIAGNLLKGNAKTAYDTIAQQLPYIAQHGGNVSFSFKSNGSSLTRQEARALFFALTADYPLEMYWHGLSFSYGSGSFSFTVADDFQGADRYTVDPAKAYAAYSTIENSAGNAARIINDARSLSTDLDRLVYFKEAICSLVSYNRAAAESSSMSYGHPWQMIWIFDNDSSTQVVCEGYAKAFQYLCDKTFTSGQVQCYSVSGIMGGNHMWNVVSFQGKNYLVDVTNCDGGDGSFTVGYPYRLFLAGGSGSPSGGYTISYPKVYTDVSSNGRASYLSAGQISYSYSSDLVWNGSSCLSLSGSSYPIFYDISQNKLFKNVQYTWKPNASDNFTFSTAANTDGFRLPEGAALSTDGTLTYTPSYVTGAQSFTIKATYRGYSGAVSTYYCTVDLPAVAEGSPEDLICNPPTGLTASYGDRLSSVTLRNPSGNTPGTWSWVNGGQTVGNVGTNRFQAVFTPDDTYFDPVTVELSVNVSPRSLSGAAVTLSQTSYEYDGTAKRPNVTVKLGSVTLTEGTDYTVSYSGNINVGTATVTITGIGNYTGTKTAKFTIGTGSGKDSSITISAAISGDTSSVDIDSSVFDNLVNQVLDNNSAKATVKVRASSTTPIVSVSLPAPSVLDLCSISDADLAIATPFATLTLPNEALYPISWNADKLELVVDKKSSNTISIELYRDGIEVDNIYGGATVTLNISNSKAGSIAVALDYYGNEEVIKKAVVKNGIMNIPIQGSTILKVTNHSKAFSDMGGHWSKNAVDFVSSRNLFQGTSDNIFSPDMTMSRAMIVTVLHRLEDEPKGGSFSFRDVPKGSWYYDSIAWAAGKGIIENSTGNYNPEGAAPREEMALLFYRYARAMGCDTSASVPLSGFSDAPQISSSAARQAMSWAVGVGLMNGMSDTTLGPNLNATRAQVATMFQRLCELVLNP